MLLLPLSMARSRHIWRELLRYPAVHESTFGHGSDDDDDDDAWEFEVIMEVWIHDYTFECEVGINKSAQNSNLAR